MILQSTSGLAAQPWVWTVVLSVGFLTLVGLARAGVIVFWHMQLEDEVPPSASGASLKLLSSAWAFMAVTVVLAVMASPVKRYTDAAAMQLADKAAYSRTVLGARGWMRRPRAPMTPPGASASQTCAFGGIAMNTETTTTGLASPRPAGWFAHPVLSALLGGAGWRFPTALRQCTCCRPC
ncbi:MAG: hypothetical protein R3E42_00710 [Burkholderiaceae bacterium]